MNQCLPIHLALEEDDIPQWLPVFDPTPAVELRRRRGVEPEPALPGQEPKEEPALFLANAQGAPLAAHILLGKAIPEPIRRTAEERNVFRDEPNFLTKLAVHGLLGRFVQTNAALGKLPGVLSYAAAYQHEAARIAHDDPDVRAEAFFIDLIHAAPLTAAEFFHSNRRAVTVTSALQYTRRIRRLPGWLAPAHTMPHSPRRLLVILATLSVAALLFAVSTGSGAAGPGTLRALVSGNADPVAAEILLRLRLPRALAAFGTGAALALAGALMQVLLRNPLADPYVLGTSGGAAVGALGAMLLGAASLVVEASAFAGALLSTVLVFTLARSGGAWYDGRGYGSGAASRLLLTGIVVASGWSAVVSLLLATSPEANLRGLLFWLMGDFSFVERPAPIVAVAAVGAAAGLALARTLNVLGTGDWQAALLGVEVRRTRTAIYALSALLTSLAVTTAGVVGFVGLIVPHFVRLAGGSDHRVVIPGSALAGGTLLVLADTLARTLLAPRQLPVGAITAAVGVPAFLYLLRRSLRNGQ